MARFEAGPSGDVTGRTRGYAISAAISRLQEGSSPLAAVNFLRGLVKGLSPGAAGEIYQAAKVKVAQIKSIATRPTASVIPQDYHLQRSAIIPAYRYVVNVTYTDANTGAFNSRAMVIDAASQLSMNGLVARATRLIPQVERLSPGQRQTTEPSNPTGVAVEVTRAYCRSC